MGRRVPLNFLQAPNGDYFRGIFRGHALPRRKSATEFPVANIQKYSVCLWGCQPINTNLSMEFKAAVNTIVPRSPFFLFLYLKTQTVTHIRKNAVEYLRQWNGAICVIYNLCQRQKIR